jgi:hypothetical protein
MASPFSAARVNDMAVEVQLTPNGPFFGLLTIMGVDPLPLAHATDDDFVLALPELLNMAGVHPSSSFQEGDRVEVELENPTTCEVEDRTLVATAANYAHAKANPSLRAHAPPGTAEYDQEALENEHMADMDDAANHAQTEQVKRAQKKRVLVGLTAEAINSVIKMAKANGLATEHVEQAFVAAGGVLPTAEDRAAFENDDDVDEDMRGAPGGAAGGPQCQQQ